MVAIRKPAEAICIGKDFVEATRGKTVWNVEALGYGYKFRINFECTGDEACQAAQQTMTQAGIKARGFIFARV